MNNFKYYNNIVKFINIQTLKYLIVLAIVVKLTNALIANQPTQQLIIAPTTNIIKQINVLKINAFYSNTFSLDGSKSTNIGFEFNPFWEINKNYFFSILNKIYLGAHYHKNTFSNTNYTSRISGFHNNIQYNILDTKLFSVYYGVGLGKNKYNSLFITEDDTINNVVENKTIISYYIGSDFGLFNLLSGTILSQLFKEIAYLNNLYTNIEIREYKLRSNNQIKYIDDYSYRVYNIGVKYKIPLYSKYILK